MNSESAIPAFSPVVDSAADYLASLPPPFGVATGTTLLEQEQTLDSVYLIRSGIVKLICTNRQGQEIHLGLRSVGWWINGTLALLGLPSLCSVTALTDCSLTCMPSSEFSRKLLSDSRMLRQFLSTQCRELLMVQQHSIMRRSSAAERLKYLQEEGQQSIWTVVDPTLVMRRREVAELLSISPEYLSRLTSK